jgi:hypothetical protein
VESMAGGGGGVHRQRQDEREHEALQGHA